MPDSNVVFFKSSTFYSLQGVQSFINGFISKKAIDLLFTGFRGGSNFFQGGGGGGCQLFHGGVQMLFSIGTM